MRRTGCLALTAWMLFAAGSASAQTFRQFLPIFVPDPETRQAILQGLQLRGAALPGLQQVPRETVEAAVRKIYAAYNTPDFQQYLSERFYDSERLVEAINEKVPREAKLRLITINSAQTVSRRAAQDDEGRDVTESLVLVVVRAQMEFTSVAGFQRREGEQELLLRFREK